MRKPSTDTTVMNKLLPVLIVAGAAFLWSCGESKAPVPEATAAAETPPAKPRAEQALLDDLAVANRILAKELAILDVQGHVTARSLVNPNHYYIARFIAPGAVTTSVLPSQRPMESPLYILPIDSASSSCLVVSVGTRRNALPAPS